MRKKYRYMFLIILLFISIAFAILSSNVSIMSNIGIANSTFDVHFEDAKVTSSNINNYNLPIINESKDTIAIDVDLDKPGDYINISFLVVNSGIIDAQLNEIISTSLTTEEAKYIEFNYNYDNGDSLAIGDLLRSGKKKMVVMTYKYKYDVTNLINISSKKINLSLKYIQPKDYNDKVWTYDYTNTYQTFTATHTGNYKIELWGASGEVDPAGGKGGYGGYTSGTITLNKNDKLYVYVGGIGKIWKILKVGYNGGSNGQFGGGGSTDVRLVNGEWNNFTSLKSRIMVAGAGAGNDDADVAGSAGGLNGYDGRGQGGTQTQGGVGTGSGGFGYGGGDGIHSPSGNGGGGSGYFGGSSSTVVARYGGAGGSSYISGHIGCVAIEETSTSDNITFPTKNNKLCADGTIDIECSKHYSGKYFINTIMIDGKGYEWKYKSGNTSVTAGTDVVGMPTHDGTDTMIGNIGNGYAKITYLD